jgi:hypothetical protein
MRWGILLPMLILNSIRILLSSLTFKGTNQVIHMHIHLPLALAMPSQARFKLTLAPSLDMDMA